MHLIYAGFATNWCILNRDTVDACFATEVAVFTAGEGALKS
jgi:hypothetical protein